MNPANAKALNDRQRRYDEAHHAMRLEWLSEPKPLYADGEPLCGYEVLSLKNSSEECLRSIREHGMSVHSVDLGDTVYLAELDEFMVQRKA